MQDFEYTLLMLLVLLAGACLYLVAVVRSQKRTIAALGAGSGPNEARLAEKERELDNLRERMKVLERITVDKENSLSREIEQLRER